jgi:hypothetical protein
VFVTKDEEKIDRSHEVLGIFRKKRVYLLRKEKNTRNFKPGMDKILGFWVSFSHLS